MHRAVTHFCVQVTKQPGSSNAKRTWTLRTQRNITQYERQHHHGAAVGPNLTWIGPAWRQARVSSAMPAH